MPVAFHLTRRKAEAWPLPAQIYVTQTPYHTQTLHFGPHFYSFTLLFSSPCTMFFLLFLEHAKPPLTSGHLYSFFCSLCGEYTFSHLLLSGNLSCETFGPFFVEGILWDYVLLEVTRTLLANATSRLGFWPHVTEYVRIMSKVIAYAYRVLCVTRFLPILFPAKL